MTNKKYQIYIIENKINQKKYIGTTYSTFLERYKGPKWWLNVTSTSLQAELMEFGQKNFFITEDYEIFDTEAKAKRRERDLQDEFKTRDPKSGYNLADGAGGTSAWCKSTLSRGKLDVFKDPEEMIKFEKGFFKFHNRVLTPFIDDEEKQVFINENWNGSEFKEYQKLLRLFINYHGEEYFRFFALSKAMGISIARARDIITEHYKGTHS